MKRGLNKKTLADVDVAGKRVLVRVDFNVPMDDGRITDDTRIRGALPTLSYLLDRDCALILVSHLGRPKGKVVEELRLGPVAVALGELLNRPVRYVAEVAGPSVTRQVEDLKPGDVLLLENVRFDPREEANDPGFARELAALADVFVSDAFGVAHRAHASNVGVAQFLPSVAGKLVEAELAALSRLLVNPDKPFWAVIGGAKVSDKLGVLEGLLDTCDGLIIGGGMANTFLAAQGVEVGASLVEKELFAKARSILERASQQGVEVLLPQDVVVAETFSAGARHQTVPVEQIPSGWMALDVGPASLQAYAEALRGAGTIFWNGPLGVFEFKPFARGTVQMAQVVADSEAWSVVAGGDSVAAVQQTGLAHRIGHICTGGGASLKLLAGEPMPGIDVLPDADPGERRGA